MDIKSFWRVVWMQPKDTVVGITILFFLMGPFLLYFQGFHLNSWLQDWHGLGKQDLIRTNWLPIGAPNYQHRPSFMKLTVPGTQPQSRQDDGPCGVHWPHVDLVLSHTASAVRGVKISWTESCQGVLGGSRALLSGVSTELSESLVLVWFTAGLALSGSNPLT